MRLNVTISVGDFIDRYSILQVKHVNGLQVLDEFAEYEKMRSMFDTRSFEHYLSMFVSINSCLWKLEDEKRSKTLEVGSTDYFEVSELITHLNDLRYQIKKSADKHFGSEIQEKKSHEQ